jgi:hypothetical protein
MNTTNELEHDGALEEDYEDEEIGETTLTPTILPLLSDMPTLNQNNHSITAATTAATTTWATTAELFAGDDEDIPILEPVHYPLRSSCADPEQYFRTHGHHFGHTPPGYEYMWKHCGRNTSGSGDVPVDGGISGFGVIACPAPAPGDQFLQRYASTHAATAEPSDLVALSAQEEEDDI